MNNTSPLHPLSLEAPKKKVFDFNLETLRGVAAILVVWGHATVQNGWIDPGYYPTGVWSYGGPGHVAVLVFFLLSGYVIGLNHQVPLARTTVFTYLKKRFVRLYPIYVLCLLLALVVTKESYPASTIASHFALTQGLTSPVIAAFGPAWSLAYEVIFYLLFIPISMFRINPVPVALLVVFVGCVDAYFYPRYGSALMPSYAFGFAFWLCGLSLAKYLPKLRQATSYALMVSLLFLFMAIGKLDAPATF